MQVIHVQVPSHWAHSKHFLSSIPFWLAAYITLHVGPHQAHLNFRIDGGPC